MEYGKMIKRKDAKTLSTEQRVGHKRLKKHIRLEPNDPFFNHGFYGWHGSDPPIRILTQRHGGAGTEPEIFADQRLVLRNKLGPLSV
jgi:hypothetical protein